MNWREGKDKHGKIGSAQVWVKRDTGRQCIVVGRNRKDCWMVSFIPRTPSSSHVLKERDIYKYYDRIS